ncbi:MAG: ATP-binding cassette domain-containing protein [Ghiorsea sp.]
MKKVLEVKELRKVFQSGSFLFGASKENVAVNKLSFELHAGETLAIVGESGSGKSTTARLAMRLLGLDDGDVLWNGISVVSLQGKALREQRKTIQMVFQDPFASLNPKMKIVDTVGEGLRVHFPKLNTKQRREKVSETLKLCGLGKDALDRYPHQFSGGQRQRVGIARALIVEPDILVLDEPVSALDVSVQAQILNLLKQLQAEKKLAYLFISHDLSVVQHIANKVMVMFAGHVVEEGNIEDVFNHPKHPYTKSLLDAKPIAHPNQRVEAVDIKNDEGVNEQGCAFASRCAYVQEDCASFDMQQVDGCACLHPLSSH